MDGSRYGVKFYMHWSSFSDFVHMGGYGAFVWGSYGVTFVLLIGEVLMLLKRRSAPAQHSVPELERLETQNTKLETAL